MAQPVLELESSSTLDRILAVCLDVLKADRAVLFLKHPPESTPQIAASIGLSKRYLDAVSRNWRELPVGRMVQEPEFVVWPDAREELRFQAIRAEIESEGFRSLVSVALLSDGVFRGWLTLCFDEIRHLSAEEEHTVQTFADMAVIAIENAQLFENAQNRAATLEILDKITKTINFTLRLDELFKITLEQVKRVIPPYNGKMTLRPGLAAGRHQYFFYFINVSAGA